MKLDDLIGKTVGFCGVDNLTFCVVTPEGERVAFEAVEDPDDGYRSMLEDVKSVPLESLIFFARPVATLSVGEAPYISGYRLFDENDHTWLEIGTDAYDDYYPEFTFRYDPPKTSVGCQEHDDCRTDAELGLACQGALPPPRPIPEILKHLWPTEKESK
jgi:hypothetical protein